MWVYWRGQALQARAHHIEKRIELKRLRPSKASVVQTWLQIARQSIVIHNHSDRRIPDLNRVFWDDSPLTQMTIMGEKLRKIGATQRLSLFFHWLDKTIYFAYEIGITDVFPGHHYGWWVFHVKGWTRAGNSAHIHPVEVVPNAHIWVGLKMRLWNICDCIP